MITLKPITQEVILQGKETQQQMQEVFIYPAVLILLFLLFSKKFQSAFFSLIGIFSVLFLIYADTSPYNPIGVSILRYGGYDIYNLKGPSATKTMPKKLQTNKREK